MTRRTFLQAVAAATGIVAVPAFGRSALAQHAPATPGAGAATLASGAVGSVREVAVDGQPVAISPDGKWLAGPGPDDDFCIWDVETLEPTCASDRKPMAVQLETVTWAPDSSAVAFSLDAARLLVDSDIYVMDVDGTLHDLTDDGPDDKLSLTTEGPEIPVDMYPAWSPDSTQLAFARSAWGSDAKSTTIMTMPREGGDPVQRLVVSPQEPMIIYSPMHWLENGDIVLSVMHADPSNGQNGVWRLTASGGMERILEGNKDAEIPMPFVNDVSADGTLATVMSLSGYGQGLNDPSMLVFFIVNLETGAAVAIESSGEGTLAHVIGAGVFHGDGETILSPEIDAEDHVRLLQSNPDGSVASAIDVPEGSGVPTFSRGLSLATNGAAFLPVASTGGAGTRGGILFTIDA